MTIIGFSPVICTLCRVTEIRDSLMLPRSAVGELGAMVNSAVLRGVKPMPETRR